MTVTTQQVRDWWGPHCQADDRGVTIDFGVDGARITVDFRTVDIWLAVAAIFAAHGYRIRKADTGAYNCRRITGGTGYSLHAYLIAVDVNWSTNPYGPRLVTDMPPVAIREIETLEVDGERVLRWGGRYSGNKDAMHFEVVVPPATAAKFHYEEGLTVAEAQEIIKATREIVQNQIGKLGDRIVDAIKDGNKAQTAAVRRAVWTAQGRTADEIDELEAALGQD